MHFNLKDGRSLVLSERVLVSVPIENLPKSKIIEYLKEVQSERDELLRKNEAINRHLSFSAQREEIFRQKLHDMGLSNKDILELTEGKIKDE